MNLATKVRLAAWAVAGVLLALPAVSAKPAKETFALGNLFATHCIQCHGKEGKVKGKVDLLKYSEGADLSEDSELLQAVLDVIDFGEMPPEDELQLTSTDLKDLLNYLRLMLNTATKGKGTKINPPRRLNRFQYNNTVRDLFQLNRDIFSMSENMMFDLSNALSIVFISLKLVKFHQIKVF